MCGLVGLAILALVLGPLAVILGIVALQQIQTGGQYGRGMAIAGIVLGPIDIAFYLVVRALVD